MYLDFGYTLAYAQTVCTRPSFGGPGDEATIDDTMYMVGLPHP